MIFHITLADNSIATTTSNDHDCTDNMDNSYDDTYGNHYNNDDSDVDGVVMLMRMKIIMIITIINSGH